MLSASNIIDVRPNKLRGRRNGPQTRGKPSYFSRTAARVRVTLAMDRLVGK
ncbi:MAG: hypothetical protein V3T12_01015 [Acidiferrobacterales bacterium]